MKADFETIGKQLPYMETKGYVDSLVEQCANRALAGQASTAMLQKRRFMRHTSLAATTMAAAILAAVALFPFLTGKGSNNSANMITAETIAHSLSLNDVLSGLSNDELAAIDYYSFDYIPSDNYDEND